MSDIQGGLIRRAGRRLGGLPVALARRVDELPVRFGYWCQGMPLPPGRLMHRVGGTRDVDWFVRSGRWAAEDLRSIAHEQGRPPEGLGAVLDFGCGVGRVLRHWADLADRGVRLHGTDYNPALVAWCRRRLPFARFGVNGLDGRLEYADATFDLAYALSVFTHLDESRQGRWMSELRRVLKPGGVLILTLHGEAYRGTLRAVEAERFERGDLVVVGGRDEGSNRCAAFHPGPYVRHRLASGWDVVDHKPGAARGNPVQDYYVLRRPAASRGPIALAG